MGKIWVYYLLRDALGENGKSKSLYFDFTVIKSRSVSSTNSASEYALNSKWYISLSVSKWKGMNCTDLPNSISIYNTKCLSYLLVFFLPISPLERDLLIAWRKLDIFSTFNIFIPDVSECQKNWSSWFPSIIKLVSDSVLSAQNSGQNGYSKLCNYQSHIRKIHVTVSWT